MIHSLDLILRRQIVAKRNTAVVDMEVNAEVASSHMDKKKLLRR